MINFACELFNQIKTIMKKNVLFIAMGAALLMSSCASKKELAGCREENKTLTTTLQTTKEDLAGKNARIASLEEQVGTPADTRGPWVGLRKVQRGGGRLLGERGAVSQAGMWKGPESSRRGVGRLWPNTPYF